MQMVRRIAGAALALALCVPAAAAQDTHVIGTAALGQAVQQRVSQDQTDRETIRAFLNRADVRTLAARAGISMEKADAAVATLQGQDLHRIADQVRTTNQQLAGGASTVVISTTTIIIVLLLVILIIAIAK
jgi:DNA uptake protein ComE-like DNA-binding protein